MKVGRMLRGAAILTAFVMLSNVIGSFVAIAEQSEDLGALNQQVTQLLRAGEYAEGAALAARALSLAEHQFGADHPMVAIALDNLGQMYFAQGRYAETE